MSKQSDFHEAAVNGCPNFEFFGLPCRLDKSQLRHGRQSSVLPFLYVPLFKLHSPYSTASINSRIQFWLHRRYWNLDSFEDLYIIWKEVLWSNTLAHESGTWDLTTVYIWHNFGEEYLMSRNSFQFAPSSLTISCWKHYFFYIIFYNYRILNLSLGIRNAFLSCVICSIWQLISI